MATAARRLVTAENMVATIARLAYSGPVFEARVQLFAIALEVCFVRPRPFEEAKLDELAAWLTDPLDGFALRAGQVRVRRTDPVFDYELSASLFGGNATLTRDAEKTLFSARGARNHRDAEILEQTAVRFVNSVAVPDQLEVSVSVNAHASLASEEIRAACLGRFRVDDRVIGPGALGFARVDGWPEDIRIAIEPSVGVPESLFFSWHTRLLPAGQPVQALRPLADALQSAARIYGISLSLGPA